MVDCRCSGTPVEQQPGEGGALCYLAGLGPRTHRALEGEKQKQAPQPTACLSKSAGPNQSSCWPLRPYLLPHKFCPERAPPSMPCTRQNAGAVPQVSACPNPAPPAWIAASPPPPGPVVPPAAGRTFQTTALISPPAQCHPWLRARHGDLQLAHRLLCDHICLLRDQQSSQAHFSSSSKALLSGSQLTKRRHCDHLTVEVKQPTLFFLTCRHC